MSNETTPREKQKVVDDDRYHQEVMRMADSTLKEAEQSIREGRERLRRAMVRYSERKRG